MGASEEGTAQLDTWSIHVQARWPMMDSSCISLLWGNTHASAPKEVGALLLLAQSFPKLDQIPEQSFELMLAFWNPMMGDGGIYTNAIWKLCGNHPNSCPKV